MTTRRELWEKALAEGPHMRKLSILLLDYIDLLSAELDETIPLAYAHGWRSTRAAEGDRLRAEIESHGAPKPWTDDQKKALADVADALLKNNSQPAKEGK